MNLEKGKQVQLGAPSQFLTRKKVGYSTFNALSPVANILCDLCGRLRHLGSPLIRISFTLISFFVRRIFLACSQGDRVTSRLHPRKESEKKRKKAKENKRKNR